MSLNNLLLPYDNEYFKSEKDRKNKKIKKAILENRKKAAFQREKEYPSDSSLDIPIPVHAREHSFLEDVIRNFSADSAQMAVMSPATGDGKTYATAEFITKSFMASLPEYKNAACLRAYRDHNYGLYIFMTPVKVNLPKEKIKKFMKSCLEELRAEGFPIENVDDESERLYQNNVQEFSGKGDIPSEKFKEAIAELQKFCRRKKDPFVSTFAEINNILKECLKTVESCEKIIASKNFSRDDRENARNRRNRAYDGMLRDVIDHIRLIAVKNAKTKDEKTVYKDMMQLVFNDERFQWFEIICPTLRSENKKIWLMSSTKFLFSNTLLHRKCLPFRSEVALGAYGDVFIAIDEFDETYMKWLDNMIERAVVNRVDVLDVYRKLFFSPNLEKFHPDDEKYRELREKINEFAAKEHLDRPVFMHDDTVSRIAYFATPSGNIIMGPQVRNIIFNCLDGTVRVTQLMNKKEPGKPFFPLVYDVSSFLLRDFLPHILDMARKESNKDDRRDIKRHFDAFVHYLGVQDMKELFDSVNNAQIKGPHIFTSEEPAEACVADTGVSVFSAECLAEISENSGRQMQVFVQEMAETPEKVILELFSGKRRVKVLGMSATAGIESCIGNFNFGFLRRKLKFYEYSPQDRELMHLAGERNRKNSGKTHVSLVSVPSMFSTAGTFQKSMERARKNFVRDDQAFQEVLADALRQFVRDAETVRNLSEILSSKGYMEKILDNDQDEANFAIYRLNEDLKGIFAFNEFFVRKSVRTLVWFKNAYPDENFTKTPLYRCLKEIGGEEVEIHVLKNGAEQDLKEICAAAAGKLRNKKHFVITTYGFASRGMDFILPYDEGEENFSGIYLGCPTNVMVTSVPSGPESDKQFMKGLVEQRQFLESGDITFEECRKNVDRLYSFQSFGRKRKIPIKKLDDRSGYRKKCAQIAVQTVGRIQRVEKYSEETLFLVDEDFLALLDPQDFECDSWAAGQLAKLREEWRHPRISPDDAEFIRQVNLKNMEDSQRRKNRLRKYFQQGWPQKAMNDWEDDRKFILSHPTLSEEEMESFREKDDLYVRMPEKTSSYEFETESIEGSFMEKSRILLDGHSKEKEPEWHRIRVSEDTCRLKYAMTIPGFEDWMTSKGYATSFVPASYIISPFSYFNYLGALGEEIFSFYADKILRLSPFLPLNRCDMSMDVPKSHTYEKFDFMSADGSAVIDVKFWNLEYRTEIREEDKIAEKVRTCMRYGIHVRNVLYVNIFSDEGLPCEQPREVQLDDGRTFHIFCIPQLYILKDGNAVPDGEAFNVISGILKRG